MEPFSVLYTVYIKHEEFDIKFLRDKKPDYALNHVPNALFTFVHFQYPRKTGTVPPLVA